MSFQFLSMQSLPGRPCTDIIIISRIPRRYSSYEPPPRRRIHSTSRKFNCIAAVLANPAFPDRTAKKLQEEFGCQGVNFLDIADTTAVDLKLNNGCKARLALRTAQITSYKAHMWHGGEEQLLHTVRAGREQATADSVRGGINLLFFHSQDPESVILPPSTDSWCVADVRCEPSNYAQIILTTSSNSEVGITDAGKRCLQSRYVVTLTKKSLSSAVVLKNNGLAPVEFTGSIVSHLAVSSVEGAFVVGLNECSYLSLSSSPTQQFNNLFKENNFSPPVWGSETMTKFGHPATPTISHSDRTDSVREFGQGRWIVENEDYSNLHGGEGRLYSMPPSSFTLLDRGFRRSLIVERIGFQDVWVSNPGPDSKLLDWNKFMCVGPSQNSQSVTLRENEEWRAAQILSNPGFD